MDGTPWSAAGARNAPGAALAPPTAEASTGAAGGAILRPPGAEGSAAGSSGLGGERAGASTHAPPPPPAAARAPSAALGGRLTGAVAALASCVCHADTVTRRCSCAPGGALAPRAAANRINVGPIWQAEQDIWSYLAAAPRVHIPIMGPHAVSDMHAFADPSAISTHRWAEPTPVTMHSVQRSCSILSMQTAAPHRSSSTVVSCHPLQLPSGVPLCGRQRRAARRLRLEHRLQHVRRRRRVNGGPRRRRRLSQWPAQPESAALIDHMRSTRGRPTARSNAWLSNRDQVSYSACQRGPSASYQFGRAPGAVPLVVVRPNHTKVRQSPK
jgi:hypothetical protein